MMLEGTISLLLSPKTNKITSLIHSSIYQKLNI